MRLLRILHRWLGLIVGLQLVLWTVSGLAFAWLDRREVGAESGVRSPPRRALMQEARLLEPGAPLSNYPDVPVLGLALVPLGDDWVYRVQLADRIELRRADDGSRFVIADPVVRRLAADRYAGRGALREVRYHATPTLDSRSAGASWEAAFDDPERTSIYFSAEDGGLLAVRNDTWRLYDVFWMLHTMDYRGRDDFNNPLVILVSTGALWLGISGALLLLQSFGLTRPRDAR